MSLRRPSELGMAAVIGRSGLFDAKWYLAKNPDVAAAGIDPLLHYLRHGETELRNPSEDFDLALYAPLYRNGQNILYQHARRLEQAKAKNDGLAK